MLNYLDDDHLEENELCIFHWLCLEEWDCNLYKKLFAQAGFISSQMDLDLNNNLFSEIEELIQTFTEIDKINENL